MGSRRAREKEKQRETERERQRVSGMECCKRKHFKLPQLRQLRFKHTNCLTFNRFMAHLPAQLPHAAPAIPQSGLAVPFARHAPLSFKSCRPEETVNDCSPDDALIKNARPGQAGPDKSTHTHTDTLPDRSRHNNLGEAARTFSLMHAAMCKVLGDRAQSKPKPKPSRSEPKQTQPNSV